MKNKDKYDLRLLNIIDCKYSYIIGKNINYIDIECNERFVGRIAYQTVSGLKEFIEWLEEEDDEEGCKHTILTDKEKAYLSAIIKPFGNKKIMIGRLRHLFGEEEYIWIDIDGYHFALPHFKKGEMYKGMELNKFHTSEELGL